MADSDVVVATAQIPGMRSPLLVTADMVAAMRPGSLVIDLAVERGGNCEVSRADMDVDHQGVTVLAPTDLAAGSAITASRAAVQAATSSRSSWLLSGILRP